MENTRTKTTRNSLILLLTAAIWGMAFVSQSKGMDYMHPFTFNGVRSLIGAASILVYILISRKIAGDKAAPLDWKLNVKAGLLCGIFLTIASTLQQFGIKTNNFRHTTDTYTIIKAGNRNFVSFIKNSGNWRAIFVCNRNG